MSETDSYTRNLDHPFRSLFFRLFLFPFKVCVLLALPVSLPFGLDGGPIVISDLSLTEFLGWCCVLSCIVFVASALSQYLLSLPAEDVRWSLLFAGLSLVLGFFLAPIYVIAALNPGLSMFGLCAV